MKKKISIALAAFAFALLLVVGSVAGTIAYLTSQDTVTNTFTVGNIEITMDETDVNNPTGDRVKVNEYHLLPGHTYVKDPVIHIKADSETCYLFVKVENQLATIEKAGETVEDQLEANKWKALNGVDNVYYIELADISDSDTADNDIDVKVFEKIVISANVDNTTLKDYAGKTITVTAYAIQADGLTDAATAWTAGGFN